MPGRSSYHHGNLRQALVDEAAALIAEAGPPGATLAEAARRAGVSAAAPYRHFESRDALIVAVAQQGFTAFAERLDAAFDAGRPRPLAAFLRLGEAYLAFAAERPGFYMAMFESGVSIAADPDLSRAADAAQAVLRRAAEALFAALPPDTAPPPPRMVADHIWALSHGVVELFGRGAPGARSAIAPAEMLESGVLIYLRGLGVIR